MRHRIPLIISLLAMSNFAHGQSALGFDPSTPIIYGIMFAVVIGIAFGIKSFLTTAEKEGVDPGKKLMDNFSNHQMFYVELIIIFFNVIEAAVPALLRDDPSTRLLVLFQHGLICASGILLGFGLSRGLTYFLYNLQISYDIQFKDTALSIKAARTAGNYNLVLEELNDKKEKVQRVIEATDEYIVSVSHKKVFTTLVLVLISFAMSIYIPYLAFGLIVHAIGYPFIPTYNLDLLVLVDGKEVPAMLYTSMTILKLHLGLTAFIVIYGILHALSDTTDAYDTAKRKICDDEAKEKKKDKKDKDQKDMTDEERKKDDERKREERKKSEPLVFFDALSDTMKEKINQIIGKIFQEEAVKHKEHNVARDKHAAYPFGIIPSFPESDPRNKDKVTWANVMTKGVEAVGESKKEALQTIVDSIHLVQAQATESSTNISHEEANSRTKKLVKDIFALWTK